MSQGRKTGGRNFKPGAPGRPKGAKDKYPRTAKAAIRQLLEQYGQNTALLSQVLADGLASRNAFPWFQLLVEQHLGAAEQPSVTAIVELLQRKVVHKLYPGPTRLESSRPNRGQLEAGTEPRVAITRNGSS